MKNVVFLIFLSSNYPVVVMIFLYWTLLFLLSIYGIHRLHILYLVATTKAIGEKRSDKRPNVVVQIPIFNERFVARRIIQSCASLDWPKEHLWIQVLDDSTDDTTSIISTLVLELQSQGYNVELRHRSERDGYKAGALKEGLEAIQNRIDVEYVAIFDADFVPCRDFLQRSLPYFEDRNVGMVQSRWDHINRDENWLTSWSAILLDGHFVLEHSARFQSGRIFNFNGTAGVWRIKAIVDAGGWQHDTITEDLDLSYRAAMKGWNFIYLPKNIAPAELPATVKSFTAQQNRWAKGTMQVAKKLLMPLWHSNISLKAKIEGSIHFTNNIAYPLTALLIALMPITAPIRNYSWFDGIVFICTCASIALFYATALWKIDLLKKNWWHIVPTLALGVGMTFRQSLAVFQGLFGNDRHFIRTPKKGNMGNNISKYLSSLPVGEFSYVSIIEILFASYCVYQSMLLFDLQLYGSIPFLLLFSFGFYFVGLGSFWESFGHIWIQNIRRNPKGTVSFDKNLPKHP